MPQMANQDYNVISVPDQLSESVFGSVAVLRHIEQQNIFDVIIDQQSTSGYKGKSRIVAVYEDYETGRPGIVYFNGNIQSSVLFQFTLAQYEGLAAIAEARGLDSIAELGISNGTLGILFEETRICVDGYLLNAINTDGKLTGLSIGNKATGEFIDITWEDAQKLIGLPVSSE